MLAAAFLVQVPGLANLGTPPQILCTDFDGTLTQHADSTSALLKAAARSSGDDSEIASRSAELSAMVEAFVARKKAHDEAVRDLDVKSAMARRMAFEREAYQPLAHALRGVTPTALNAVGASLPLRPDALHTLGLARAVGMAVHVLTLNPSSDCVKGALHIAGPTDDDGLCCGIKIHSTEVAFAEDSSTREPVSPCTCIAAPKHTDSRPDALSTPLCLLLSSGSTAEVRRTSPNGDLVADSRVTSLLRGRTRRPPLLRQAYAMGKVNADG